MAIPFFSFDVWHILNLDTGEEVKGRFPAEDVTETIGAEWAAHWALNRQNAILQFLHGAEDTISFTATLFAETVLMNLNRDLERLKKMARRDKITGRPPVLQFWIGDGHLSAVCVCDSITIKRERPQFMGGLHQAQLTFNLRTYKPYVPGLVSNFDTRYHVARAGDSYEMLCQKEYGAPLLGVIIRQRHPSMPVVPTPGQIVKLPSIQGLRTAEVAMASYMFSRLSDGDSVQAQRLAAIVKARSAGAFSKLLTA